MAIERLTAAAGVRASPQGSCVVADGIAGALDAQMQEGVQADRGAVDEPFLMAGAVGVVGGHLSVLSRRLNSRGLGSAGSDVVDKIQQFRHYERASVLGEVQIQQELAAVSEEVA